MHIRLVSDFFGYFLIVGVLEDMASSPSLICGQRSMLEITRTAAKFLAIRSVSTTALLQAHIRRLQECTWEDLLGKHYSGIAERLIIYYIFNYIGPI